jgi:hypothetical protein
MANKSHLVQGRGLHARPRSWRHQLTSATTASDPSWRPRLHADDMDVMLGSEAIIPQTRALVQTKGAWAKNFFVSSPKVRTYAAEMCVRARERTRACVLIVICDGALIA